MEEIKYNSEVKIANNVKDYYKQWETDAVKGDLDTKRVPMVNVCMNLTNDFNKSAVIRSNNSFLGERVILVGKRRFDRRGAVGTHSYEHIWHAEDFKDVFDTLKADGYTIYAVDNIESYDPLPLWDTQLPEKSAFVYGEEQLGLSDEVIKMCDAMLFIPMYGSVRSLNVGTAAAIMMSEYARQHRSLYEA